MFHIIQGLAASENEIRIKIKIKIKIRIKIKMKIKIRIKIKMKIMRGAPRLLNLNLTHNLNPLMILIQFRSFGFYECDQLCFLSPRVLSISGISARMVVPSPRADLTLRAPPT